MQKIDPENPPRPCDVFDLIGGTSTGGLIAIMLGRLKMSVDECIEAYQGLAEQAFRPRFWKLNTPRFDGTAIENYFKSLIARKGLDKDALLVEADNPKCKT